MANDHSRDALLTFLKEAAHAGLINPATARSRRNAALQLFAHLSDEEAADLRRVDVDQLAARFHKLQGGTVRPEVLELYAGRLRGALDDYFSYLDAPDSFASARTERAPRRRPGPDHVRSPEQRALEQFRLGETHHRPDVIPIPIREDRVVYLHSLPADLTAAEARKITRVIEALVEEPGAAE